MRNRRLVFVVLVLACGLSAVRAEVVRVLATGDMHGWLQPQDAQGQVLGGAAEMLAAWQAVEDYTPERFLVVSCGDIATGPAISTAFKGAPTIRVMNRMGYDVSALGNHEFDFGISTLRDWQDAAAFPFLCANLVTPDGATATLTPGYVINDEQGVTVAVIGLIFEDIAMSANTGGLVGAACADVLRALVPRVRAEGAQVVIVATHIPMDDLVALAHAVPELEIPLFLGGHSHEFGQRKIGKSWVVNSGEWWHGYSRIDLDYRPETASAVVVSAKQVWLQQTAPDADAGIRAEVARWQGQLQQEYGKTIGHTATGFTRPAAMGAFIGRCWLAEDGQAQLALFNQGGFRQDIAPGPVNKGMIVGVLPFENGLYRITMTGAQIAGMTTTAGERLGFVGLHRATDGTFTVYGQGALDPTAEYDVLVNDYLYNKSADLHACDPTPMPAFGNWREPVYAWLAKHPTSPDSPLEARSNGMPCYIPE